MTNPDDEIVAAMLQAYEDERTAEYLENGTLRDNQRDAMRAALAVARQHLISQVRATALDEAVKICFQHNVAAVFEILKLKDV